MKERASGKTSFMNNGRSPGYKRKFNIAHGGENLQEEVHKSNTLHDSVNCFKRRL